MNDARRGRRARRERARRSCVSRAPNARLACAPPRCAVRASFARVQSSGSTAVGERLWGSDSGAASGGQRNAYTREERAPASRGPSSSSAAGRTTVG